MGVFIKLCKMSVTKVGAKILVALAFIAFANMAFADSESLQKLFNEYNVGKDKQEYIKKQCDKEVLKDNFKDLSKIEQIYKFETTQIDCWVQHLGEVLGSTQGILASLSYGYDEYDKLLNKYYKLYRAEVKKKGKTTQTGAFSHEPNIKTSGQNGQDTLLEEQRAWLKLRDSYGAYIRTHHAHIYDINGGGTIYSIAASNARLGFLKMRVNELFSRYLMMITDGGVEFDSIFDPC